MNGTLPEITVDQIEAILADVLAAEQHVSALTEQGNSNARAAHSRLVKVRTALEEIHTAPARAAE